MIRRRKFQAKPMFMNKPKADVTDALTPQPDIQSSASEANETVELPSTTTDVMPVGAVEAPAAAPSELHLLSSPIQSASSGVIELAEQLLPPPPEVIVKETPLSEVGVSPIRVLSVYDGGSGTSSPRVPTSPPRPVSIGPALAGSRPASVAPTDTSSNVDLMSPTHKVIIDEDEDLDVESVHNQPQNQPTIAATTPTTSANVEDVKTAKKRRISALRHEEVIDPKKFTLADLVDWRPRTENTLRKKWVAKRQKALEKESENATIAKAEEPKAEPKFAGPRVRINEHGQMVLDEQSLVVTNEVDPNVWETVDDDLLPKKLNSLSFRKKLRTNANWTVWETDLFYEVLCATGTDFGLMNEFIPGRTRAEIKRKFNREEKLDPERIDEVLYNPTILDETFRERVIVLKQKVDAKLAEKIAAKAKVPSGRPRGRPRKIRREDDEDENGNSGENVSVFHETSVHIAQSTASATASY